MHAGEAATEQRVSGKARNNVICHAEDHHRDEPQQIHVKVHGAIHRPDRVARHHQPERYAEGEPGETCFEKAFDEPIHYDAAWVSPTGLTPFSSAVRSASRSIP